MVWTIIGSILGAIALIILIILFLPVFMRIENVSGKEANLYFKILWFKFGEERNPDSKIVKAAEKVVGLSKFRDLESIQKTVREGSLSESIKEFSGVITSLLKQLLALLKNCTVNKIYLKAQNGGDDAAEAAIGYGSVCAVVYTLVGYIEGVAKVKKNAVKLDLSCDYTKNDSEFYYDILVSVRVYKVIGALFKIAKENVERQNY